MQEGEKPALGIIGLGYVGLVSAACFAELGHTVICSDSDPLKQDLIKKNQIPFFEPELDALIQRNHNKIHLKNSISEVLKASDLLFLCVGTPEKEDGQADLTYLKSAFKEIQTGLSAKGIVLIKSTVPPGTSNLLNTQLKVTHPNAQVVSNPEFLRQGSAVADFMRPDRVILGSLNSETQDLLRQIYRPFVLNDEQILFMDNTSAELSKYATNCFLALKISFINEFALLAERLQANIQDVRRGLISDHRVSPHALMPGIGFGGSCFPKDLRALVEIGKNIGLPLYTLESALQVNDRQKQLVYEKLKFKFKSLRGRKIAILGLSFKPGTDDTRNAPSMKLIEQLLLDGAQVSAFDPKAKIPSEHPFFKGPFEQTSSPYLAAQESEAVVLITEWPEFKSLDLVALRSQMKCDFFVDGRNMFSPNQLSESGFESVGIGI